MTHVVRWTIGAALLAAGGIVAVILSAHGEVSTAEEPVRSRAPQLHLNTVGSWTLPDSFDLGGASSSRTGTAVLWAVNQPYLIVHHRGRHRLVQSDSLVHPVSAALVQHDTLLEVVDSGRRSILRLALTGNFLAEQTLDLPWQVDSAIRADSGWILAGRDVAGNGRIVALNPLGATIPLFTLPAKRYKGTTLRMQLSRAGEMVFAALAAPPYLVVQISDLAPGSSRILGPDKFTPPALPMASTDAPPLWVSLAIHSLDKGFIRVFSDLRSDQRVLTTYDEEGNLLRQTVISAPLGIIGVDPIQRVLLAARRTDRLELVHYRWRWVGVNP